VAGELAVKLLL